MTSCWLAEPPRHTQSSRGPRRAGPLTALFGLLTAAALVSVPASIPQAQAHGATARRPAPEERLTIFYTSGIGGVLEPCGCNSDPLGGIDRYASVVRAAQKRGPVMVVDGGNMLFPLGIPQEKLPAAKLKARFLAERLSELGLAGSALGAADLAAGAAFVQPPRLAANAVGPAFRAGEVRQVGAIKVGVMGVVEPDVAVSAKLAADEPFAAAAKEVARLRAAGADLVVALAAVDRSVARKLARKAGADFIVLGTVSEAGLDRADNVGKTFIVNAAAELQKAGRIELVLRRKAGGGFEPMEDAGSEASLQAGRASLERSIASLGKQLALWRKDKTADATFVNSKQQEFEALAAEQKALPARWAPPPSGSYFVNQLLPMRRALPQDKQVTKAMRTLDKAIGALNLAAVTPPPKAEPGRAHYVGDRSCAGCHKPEMKFWKTTVHAHAWKTLVDGGKQADLECVGCHVTGYGQVGGTSLGFTKALESVQCEVCHGPGSLHVAEEGLDEPATVHTLVPENTCKQCHNEKHSDTFNLTAYLRDILGPGHGEDARKKLGTGPTGGQLRRAAMAKAKASGQAQLKGL